MDSGQKERASEREQERNGDGRRETTLNGGESMSKERRHKYEEHVAGFGCRSLIVVTYLAFCIDLLFLERARSMAIAFHINTHACMLSIHLLSFDWINATQEYYYGRGKAINTYEK